MTSYEQRLRDAKLSVTAQRLAVMKVISQHPHSSADDILKKVAENIGSISKQAVYDIIHSLTEKMHKRTRKSRQSLRHPHPRLTKMPKPIRSSYH